MKNAHVIPKKEKGYEIKPVIKLIRTEKKKVKKVKKGEYIEPTCYTKPGNHDSPLYTIHVPYYGDSPSGVTY